MIAKLIVVLNEDSHPIVHNFIGFEENDYTNQGCLFMSYNEDCLSSNDTREIGNWQYKCYEICIRGDIDGNIAYWKPVKPINAHVVFNELLGSIKNKENYYD